MRDDHHHRFLGGAVDTMTATNLRMLSKKSGWFLVLRAVVRSAPHTTSPPSFLHGKGGRLVCQWMDVQMMCRMMM